MRASVYGIFGAALLVLYLLAESTGYVLFEPGERSAVPPEVRGARAGYRTHGFWYGGYHGGK